MPPPQDNPSILIVDDDDDFRDLISTIFKPYPVDLVTAVDGRDGWRKFNDMAPASIITDLQMPNMNGCELIKLIRNVSLSIPVIAISGEETMLTEALSVGASTILKKPFSTHHLSDLIEKYLDL